MLILALVSVAATGPQAASAATITYANFASVAGLTLNGAAQRQGDVLRLTPETAQRAGSAFHETLIDPAQPFHTSFTLRAHGGTAREARMAFVLQRSSAGASALGTAGNGMGYGGLAPSVAIAISPSNFLFDTNQTDLLLNGITAAPLWSYWYNGWPRYGEPFKIYVDYWPEAQRLRVSADLYPNQPGYPRDILFERTLDLAGVLGGPARVGFTAATGDTTAAQDVLNWHLDTERRDPTATELVATPNPSAPGENVTMTATVVNEIAPTRPPTGHVQFVIDDVNVGAPVPLDTDGRARFTTALAAGDYHYLAAVYRNDSTAFSDSRGSWFQYVQIDPTETTLTSSAERPKRGQPVTWTASVRNLAEPQRTPTGAVQFSIDGAPAGTPITLDDQGRAALTTSTVAIGTHAVTAAYQPGRPLFAAGSATLNQVIDRFDTTVSAHITPNPSVAGQPVAVSARVQPAGASATPSGSVQFSDEDGVPLGDPQPLTGGVATIEGVAPAGEHIVHARYSGDAQYNSGAATASLSVKRAATMTTITSSQNPVTAGGQLDFTVLVRTLAPGGVAPDGAVTIMADGEPISDPLPLGDVDGDPLASTVVATFVVPSSAGSDVIGAQYSGDLDTEPSSAEAFVQFVAATQPPAGAKPAPAPPVASATPVISTATLQLMSAELVRALKRQGLRALPKTTQRVALTSAGRITQHVYTPSAPRAGVNRPRATLLASVTKTVTAQKTVTLQLRLTAAGRRAAKQAKATKLAIVTTFTPRGGRAVVVTSRVTARARTTRAEHARTRAGGWTLTNARR